MSNVQVKTMRDALIEQIYERMYDNDRIFSYLLTWGHPPLTN